MLNNFVISMAATLSARHEVEQLNQSHDNTLQSTFSQSFKAFLMQDVCETFSRLQIIFHFAERSKGQ